MYPVVRSRDFRLQEQLQNIRMYIYSMIVFRHWIKEKTAESTVMIVAQRISTILHADQIIVLEDGQIVGKGTHKELLKNCEAYYQIASSQLSEKELEEDLKEVE